MQQFIDNNDDKVTIIRRYIHANCELGNH